MMHGVFLDTATLGDGLGSPSLNLFGIENLIQLTQFPQTPKDTATIVKRLQGADCVITNKVPIDQAVLEQCPKLAIIFTAATGVDHIDLQSCKAKGIAVCNTRNYATASVAQHVVASMLYFANTQHQYHSLVVDKTWSQQPLFSIMPYDIMELEGKTLGIIGYGHLGQKLAQLASAFGMNIKICQSFREISSNSLSPTSPPNRENFDSILQDSDFISIHCPLTAATNHLFTAQAFQAMKPTSILINTARGKIINTNALITALDNGDIRGASIDVFPTEPMPEGHPLLEPRPNLLLTPHVAWGSLEARSRLITDIALNIQGWLNNKIRNEV